MSSLKKKIAVVPGDGIGKEVIYCGMQLLEKLNQKLTLNLDFVVKDWGADKWLSEGIGLPKDALVDLKQNYTAIYFGALGDPRIPDMAHGREILLGLRQGLDLFVNLRPVKLLDLNLSPLKKQQAIDFVVVRENTEDLYTFIGGTLKKGTQDEVSIDQSVHTYKGVERIIRYAFEYATQYQRQKVTLIDKSNAISFGGGLWKRAFKIVSAEFPHVETEHLFVDVAAMEFVLRPERFDVIVTSNLFGDILTDLAAGLIGGLGICPSANFYPGKIGLFEPVHGSAPNITGKNEANPIAAFFTAGMMLDFMSIEGLSIKIEEAVKYAISKNVTTPDLGGLKTTNEVSQFVIDNVMSRI